ncbi:MAG: DNA mismatch repair endonuclease MutL [Desulfobacterales bacterium]
MSRIKILPEIVSNKIAAGEVVERPCSVIKELMENAIDAGSSRIQIDIERGGRSLMRVSDNGSGMNHDDALLAIERYATSKIFTDEDLFSIRTLGFRGEALPSIASVSRFNLVTWDELSPSGTEIAIKGGKILQVRETGAPRGTVITVNDLFFNTPARRKFLKTINTEAGHIADVVSRMALGHPNVRIQLCHNGKTVYNWPSSPDPRHRVLDVLGKEVASDLHAVHFEQEGLAVTGWTASDRHDRSTSKGIYLFVNKRFVRDRGITHAIVEGFSGRLMKGRFPLVVLYIEIPANQVDVNVHPSKHEVRFADHKKVHDAVAAAVAGAFKKRPPPQSRTMPPAVRPEEFPRPTGYHHPSPPKQRVQEPVNGPSMHAESTNPRATTADTVGQQALWGERFFSGLTLIGQVFNSYLVCQKTDGLILIDQHAAHERILYEQIRSRTENRPTSIQKLLMPENFDLGYRAARLMEELIPDLNRIGIEIEPFGGNTFSLKTIPVMLADRDVKPIVFEMIEKMMEIGFAAGLAKALDECLKIMACHGAVRANQPLSEEQMLKLLHQLDGCENPDTCPHGRPTWIRWTTTELEKKFRRIV